MADKKVKKFSDDNICRILLKKGLINEAQNKEIMVKKNHIKSRNTIELLNEEKMRDYSDLLKKNPDAEFFRMVPENSDYVTFQGNMFASGWYKYPKRKEEQYVEYTPDEIRDITNEPIKTHILELDHSESENSAFYDNRIGYSEIKGFDEETQCDITNFNIRKEFYHLTFMFAVIGNDIDWIVVFRHFRFSP